MNSKLHQQKLNEIIIDIYENQQQNQQQQQQKKEWRNEWWRDETECTHKLKKHIHTQSNGMQMINRNWHNV